MRVLLSLALSTAVFANVSYADTALDPKAVDAAKAFSDICIKSYIGEAPALDRAHFEMQSLSDDLIKQIKPEMVGRNISNVRGLTSGLMMLIYTTAEGACVGEIAEADETSTQKAFETVVRDIASNLKVKVTSQPPRKNALDGKDATTMRWLFVAPKEKATVGITTYPVAKFMAQHVATMCVNC